MKQHLVTSWLSAIGLSICSFTVFAYTPQSIEALTGPHYYSTSFFPESAQQSVFWPDSDLHALTRSMLIVEANETELPHVRYHINYSNYQDTEAPEITKEYVEITRYNLGPSLRADLLQSVDAEHLAPEVMFGIDPHVSWRFEMAPVMGMNADIVEATRRELSDEEAQNAMCFTQLCLSLEEAEIPFEHTSSVDELASLSTNYLTHTQSSSEETVRPARALEELWAAFTRYGMDYLPYDKDKPQFTFVISKDVVGQESNTLGLGVQNIVLDHTVAEVWIQRHEVLGAEVDFTEALLPR